MLRLSPPNTLSANLQLEAVRRHLAAHGTALCNAAALIAGAAGEARVLRLMSDLRSATRLDRTLRKGLVDLHRLLSLDSNSESQNGELPCWISLDPASREVEQICLLTDRFFNLLVEIGELDEAMDAAALAINTQAAA